MSILLSLFLGAFTWTFLEYMIHRFLGHEHTKNFFGWEHTAHHSRGNYFAPWYKKFGAAVGTTLVTLPPAVLLVGPVLGSAYVAGLVGFYLYYEVLHRLEHVHQGVGAYGRWARRHHFYHHFHDPKMNHGVTSPIWDMLFGTYVPVTEKIRVPEKLQMSWLVDAATGEVWPELADMYELRRRKKKAAVA